jgi:HTH-type transcriptional regulator/antitoxin HigA
MNHIKIIKTDQEHEQSLAHLMRLMDIDPTEGTPEADELEVLALLIERYEQEKYLMDPPSPIDAIKFRMDQQGLINKDLIPYIGSAPKVSEVLNGDRNLSLNMIRKLNKGLGISAEVLIAKPLQKEAVNHDIAWHQFPLSDMRKRGYFGDFTGGLPELKEYAEEKLTQFLSTVSGGFALQPTLLRTSAHIRSNDKETDEYSLWAWQVRVQQHANRESLLTPYQTGTVNKGWMQKLVQLSWSDKGPLLAREYLNSHGIHLVFEPHLPKTYLDGAVCVSASGNPIVALTLRHDRLDNFWFTLMHELAHVALHIDGDEQWFIDDLDAHSTDKKEQEADDLAQKALLSVEDSVLESLYDSDAVRQLSKQLAVNPCIIAGRLRHDRKDHRLFGRVFRDKVKSVFEYA